MKKIYSAPSVEFVELDSRDIIATSGPGIEDEVINPGLPNLAPPIFDPFNLDEDF